jgi:hypothetical protein
MIGIESGRGLKEKIKIFSICIQMVQMVLLCDPIGLVYLVEERKTQSK